MRVLILGRKAEKANEISISLDVFPGHSRLEDMTTPWPLQSNYFDEIVSDTVLEPADVGLFLSECYRVLVKGGTISINIKLNTGGLYFVMQRFKKPVWDEKELKLTAVK